MRIIGGTYKGRIFRPNKKFTARPTTDIAKEALFNILENRYDFTTKSMLDLFAGTGSIAYEFISRGCKHATLVENNYNHYRFILDVLKQLKIENATVYKADVFKFVQKTTSSFDFVFADPPFDLSGFDKVPDALLNTGVLGSEGLLIVEHPKEYDFSMHPNFKELRKYGKVNFSFFEKEKASVQ